MMSDENKSSKINNDSENVDSMLPDSENPNMKWYVIQTTSGMENKVKASLEERITKHGFQDSFGSILVPTETVEQIKNNVRKMTSRKCLPGYVIVQMVLNPESSQLVRGTSKVLGFVGGSKLPLPITKKEAERMLHLSHGVKTTIVSLEFHEGENIKITEGPFANFQGLIEEVKTDKRKLRVMVSIFGRSTPVDLDFSQVEKIQ